MSLSVARRRFLQIMATCGAAMACGDRARLLGAEPPSDPAAEREAWEAFFDRAAKSYEIYRDPEHTQPLRLRPEPVYKWRAASAGNRVHGSVYVWTYGGCAEAVICFWRRTNAVVNEAHSLSTVALNPVAGSNGTWRPKAGVARHLLPDAPAVAEKPTARLAQMRRLAGAFSGHTEAGDKSERRELRVLSAPFYRYESTDPQVIDGGLFAFVCSVGTDPEIHLLLEARQTAEGVRWHYALTRFSHLNLFVSYNDKQVWESLRGANDNLDNTYWVDFGPPITASDLRDVEGRTAKKALSEK